VERMDGWMDGRSKIDEDNALRMTFAKVKNLRYSEKGCEIDLTTKEKEEPVQGAAS